MTSTRGVIFATCIVVFHASAGMAFAQNGSANIRKVELGKLELKGAQALPGVTNAFVIGAFKDQGLYSAYSEMKQGAKFPPHRHPDLRLTVVMSGTMYLGQGDTFDENKLTAYPVGTIAITPANEPHFMFARDGDVRVLEIGHGPSGSEFLKRP